MALVGSLKKVVCCGVVKFSGCVAALGASVPQCPLRDVQPLIFNFFLCQGPRDFHNDDLKMFFNGALNLQNKF